MDQATAMAEQAAAAAAAETSAATAAAAASAAAAAAKAKAIVNVVSKSDLLSLLMYAIVAALISELISWFFVFSRVDIERIKDVHSKAGKRLEKKKEEVGAAGPEKEASKPDGGKGKGKDKDSKGANKPDKKLVQLEKEFEGANNALIAIKSRAMMFTGMIHLLTFFALKDSYEGMVLAKLPFQPLSWFHPITHRNIKGTDFTDTGMIFIYALCSMAIKPNLQRWLGNAPPKTAMPASAQRLADKWSGVSG